MADSGSYTEETLNRKRKIAEQLLYGNSPPVQNWAQGLNELAKGYIGGRDLRDADAQDAKWDQGKSSAIASLLMGGGQSPPQSSPQNIMPQSNAADAISGIESGGKYDALGPETKGDRAYGKYQIMGNNIPQWSQEALGKPLTPEQFMSDPQAQDAIFNKKFGSYQDKYGPEGAAKAWFAGEGGMNNQNAKDALGTSVADYAAKFTNAMGGGNAPQQSAQNDPKARIAQMLNDPNPRVREMGQGLASKLIENQFKGPDETNDIKEFNLAKQQGFGGNLQDWIIGNKKAGATNVNVNGGGSDKQIFDSMQASSDKAAAAASGLDGLRQARAAMKSGAITGAGADARLGLQKVGALLGADPSSIQNTETFRAAIAPQVAAMLKSTVGTTNISNTDREFAEKAAGGNINLDEGSINRLLDIMEKSSIKTLKNHKQKLETVYGDPEANKRERALFNVDYSEDAPIQETVPDAAKVRKFNPATGRIE